MKMNTDTFIIASDVLPKGFDGFTVAHVSDLHNREFGTVLPDGVKAVRPDIIVITGDMIHRENESAAAEKFAAEAVRIAPVYYVPGNHEKVLGCYPKFKQTLIDCGVHAPENAFVPIERGGERIALLCMNDPAYFPKGKTDFITELNRLTAEIAAEGMRYTVLLSHRPELFERYVEAGVQLSLCGHAHGGHVRLPFIGAIYAPNQGLFPKYTEGVYEKYGKSMVVSKGLGKSSWVPRVFNPPELAVEILRYAENRS